MKKPADEGISAANCRHQDAISSILSDLRSAVQRIQATIRLSESAAPVAALNNEEIADDFFILDDVTPRYLMASGNLNACHTALGQAMLYLLQAQTSIVLSDFKRSTSKMSPMPPADEDRLVA